MRRITCFRPSARDGSRAARRAPGRRRASGEARARGWLVATIAIGVSSALAGPAAASQQVGANAHAVRLAVDDSGRALITFTSGGSVHKVLARGAINARPPSRTAPQVEFELDTRGGTVANTCTPAKLSLAWLVTACRASDGSFWALQSWNRLLPNTGGRGTPAQQASDLRLSHWTGPLAALDVRFGWSYRRFVQIYGRYTYLDQPVFGYRVRSGVPLDGYGRNIYVDALDSDIGKGWKRVNSFLAHGPLGGFCYGFFPHGGRLGVGTALRATVIGPGVTPDVMWQGTPRAYDAAADRAADDDLRSLLRGDPVCRAN
jgi:hypothetical protein